MTGNQPLAVLSQKTRRLVLFGGLDTVAGVPGFFARFLAGKFFRGFLVGDDRLELPTSSV
jgi:hypothetical protein